MANGYIKIDQELCKGCQLCSSFCPKGSIYVADGLNTAGYQPVAFNGESNCTGCAICALVCPEVVIEVYRD
ncbi:ferredoxin family protein [Chloroflexota bacterium]